MEKRTLAVNMKRSLIWDCKSKETWMKGELMFLDCDVLIYEIIVNVYERMVIAMHFRNYHKNKLKIVIVFYTFCSLSSQ